MKHVSNTWADSSLILQMSNALGKCAQVELYKGAIAIYYTQWCLKANVEDKWMYNYYSYAFKCILATWKLNSVLYSYV